MAPPYDETVQVATSRRIRRPHTDPSYFVEQVRANADNDRLSDSEFRQFVLNILPIYEKK